MHRYMQICTDMCTDTSLEIDINSNNYDSWQICTRHFCLFVSNILKYILNIFTVYFKYLKIKYFDKIHFDETNCRSEEGLRLE